MKTNILQFMPKKSQNDTSSLHKLLKSLKEKEQRMQNPLLKDWFDIKNQIRAVERTIAELTYDNN